MDLGTGSKSLKYITGPFSFPRPPGCSPILSIQSAPPSARPGPAPAGLQAWPPPRRLCKRGGGDPTRTEGIPCRRARPAPRGRWSLPAAGYLLADSAETTLAAADPAATALPSTWWLRSWSCSGSVPCLTPGGRIVAGAAAAFPSSLIGESHETIEEAAPRRSQRQLARSVRA